MVRCSFCGARATQKLPSGLFKGWLVCGRQACGLQQLALKPVVAVRRVTEEEEEML